MDLGEIVQIHAGMFKKAIEDSGYSSRDVVALMKSYCLNNSYISHRISKGSIPINVLKAACEVLDMDYKDFCVEYDLSDVPTYQLEDEIKARKAK